MDKLDNFLNKVFSEAKTTLTGVMMTDETRSRDDFTNLLLGCVLAAYENNEDDLED